MCSTPEQSCIAASDLTYQLPENKKFLYHAQRNRMYTLPAKRNRSFTPSTLPLLEKPRLRPWVPSCRSHPLRLHLLLRRILAVDLSLPSSSHSNLTSQLLGIASDVLVEFSAVSIELKGWRVFDSK